MSCTPGSDSPSVYVTHDQVEALALGDRLAIMRAGALEQFDTPEQVFEQPATDYVAAFIGMGNRLELERRDGRWTHDGVPIADLNLDSEAERLALRVRAADVHLAPPEGQAVPRPSPSTRQSWIPSSGAATWTWQSRSARHASSVGTPAGERGSWARTLEPGQPVRASIKRHDVKVFDDGGKLVPSGIRPVAVGA